MTSGALRAPSMNAGGRVVPTRWVGIDEAGYGPNLGPLVMTAVVAESPGDVNDANGEGPRPPDLWVDLAARVGRAGGDPDLLWVDDSKALYRPGSGRDRLEAACLALVAATGPSPSSLGGLLDALGAGTLDDVELTPWLDPEAADPPVPSVSARARVERALAGRPFDGAPWQVVSVRSVVVGPARFNAGLAAHGSKARVHFDAFARLLRTVWDLTPEDASTHVRCDKHGGRHFYFGPLADAFPDAWIDRGPEGPALSRYTVRLGGRRLKLSLQPRADSADGLVALASVVSKTVREFWMDAFNAHWAALVPGLRPTAGYPNDALRFRQSIEPLCATRGLAPGSWWRAK
jgi:hypothetical protein